MNRNMLLLLLILALLVLAHDLWKIDLTVSEGWLK